MSNSNENIFLEAEAIKQPKSEAAPVSKKNARTVPLIIEEAVEKGIRVSLGKTGYEIDGFYKAGGIRIEIVSTGLVAIDKKDKKVPIGSFDDLIRLNYDWWKKSRDKGIDFVNPSKEWLDEFVRLNLVKRQVHYIPGDD